MPRIVTAFVTGLARLGIVVLLVGVVLYWTARAMQSAAWRRLTAMIAMTGMTRAA
jgi:hypothetical protein